MLRNIGSTWVLTVVTIAATYFLTPFIIHTLGQDGYGTWTLITALTGYISLLALGVPMASVRFIAQHVTSGEHDRTNAVIGSCVGLYLMIDSSCAPPLNGDPHETGVPYIFAADGQPPVSSEAVFAATSGTHQVSVVAWTSVESPTCAQLSALQATTNVTVTDGEQILLFVYGISFMDLHLAVAPITQ